MFMALDCMAHHQHLLQAQAHLPQHDRQCIATTYENVRNHRLQLYHATRPCIMQHPIASIKTLVRLSLAVPAMTSCLPYFAVVHCIAGWSLASHHGLARQHWAGAWSATAGRQVPCITAFCAVWQWHQQQQQQQRQRATNLVECHEWHGKAWSWIWCALGPQLATAWNVTSGLVLNFQHNML